jgi:hypothetical protein
VSKIVVDGSSRTGHDESGLLGSGDDGAAARRGGECGCDAMGSGGVTRWGVECRRGTVGSGVPARCGRERRCGVVGSGDGGVRRDSMGIEERSVMRVLAR